MNKNEPRPPFRFLRASFIVLAVGLGMAALCFVAVVLYETLRPIAPPVLPAREVANTTDASSGELLNDSINETEAAPSLADRVGDEPATEPASSRVSSDRPLPQIDSSDADPLEFGAAVEAVGDGLPEWIADEMNRMFTAVIKDYRAFLRERGTMSLVEQERALYVMGRDLYEIEKRSWGVTGDDFPPSEGFRRFDARLGMDTLSVLAAMDTPEDWHDAVILCHNHGLEWETELYCIRQLGLAGIPTLVRETYFHTIDRVWTAIHAEKTPL